MDTFVIYSCTAVRIPTSRAHSESIIVLFDKPVDVAVARKALDEAPGVKLVDDPDNSQYPMPLRALQVNSQDCTTLPTHFRSEFPMC